MIEQVEQQLEALDRDFAQYKLKISSTDRQRLEIIGWKKAIRNKEDELKNYKQAMKELYPNPFVRFWKNIWYNQH